MTDTFNGPLLAVLAVVGVIALMVVSFWAGRKWSEMNSPEAKQERLTQVALDAVKELKELRTPATTADSVASAAKEAALIAELKAVTQSVT